MNTSDQVAARYKLPAEAYFEQSWLDKEKRNIFGNSWLFVGLESELPESGCYKTVVAGFDELIVVRDKEGELKAFHNTCRHRGARLVSGEGQCSSFVCPYHKWGFGLDGTLRGVPQLEQFGELDFAELGLHRASVESWMGMLFVHASETPPVDFERWTTGISEDLAVFEVDKLHLLRRDSFVFDANWKLYIENHVDWLHLWYVHPETLGHLDHSDGEVEQHGSTFISYDPVKPLHVEASNSMNPLVDLPQLANAPARYSETGAHFLFPNLPIFTGSSFFAMTDLIPLSPEKTQMNITLLGEPGGNPDEFMRLFNRITKDEDAEIIIAIQKNIRSSRFEVGPIAHTYEKAISCFHDHYLELIEGAPDVVRINAG